MFWLDNSVVMKLFQLFLHPILAFLYKYFESLFDTVLFQYGLVCVDISWWISFNKVSKAVDNVDIGLDRIMDCTGTNNQVASSHRELIGFFIILFNGGCIT